MSRPVVFISYSHKDETEKEQLVSHLKVLESAGLIELWVDDRIAGGADWEEEIKQAIARARVAILLISANFLTSDFILGKEVPAFLERRKNEGLTVFPVIAKACTWNAFDWLARMNVRPKNARPIWSGSGSQIDEDLSAIAKEVGDVVKNPPSVIPKQRVTVSTDPAPNNVPEKFQGTVPTSKPAYNLRTIRKLLTAAFTDEELRQLCYELPPFRPVYEQFSTGMSKSQVIQHLIEYCDRKGLMDELLGVVRDEVPGKYAEFEDRLRYGKTVATSSVILDSPEIDSEFDSNVEQLKKLIATETRRLHALQLQAAQYGLSTPPEVTIEIEDLEAKIAELKRELKS